MYRLVIYYLSALVVSVVVLGSVGILPYDPFNVVATTLFLVVFCFIFNWFFATLFRVRPNPESQLITALILALIIGPINMETGIVVLLVAAFFAMGSKYVLAYKQRHLFNPAIIGALSVALMFGYGTSWWVGNAYLLPVILIGGVLAATKVGKWESIGAFFAAFFVTTFGELIAMGYSFPVALDIVASPQTIAPIAFFAFVMLIEPMTSPQNGRVQYYYGALVAVLFVKLEITASIAPYALELALLAGNVFTRAFFFDPRVVLTLRKKEVVAKNTMSFWFEPSHSVSFMSGQFMQWELPHRRPDDRGIRRFFTVCSSPTEHRLMLTTKFAEPSSSFKGALHAMKEGDMMVASGVAGRFILPADSDTSPCVFIAGGIGVTPFRSMIKYMLDTKRSRPVTLLYTNKTADDIAFKPLFDEAVSAGWLKAVYTITESIPYGWRGRTGYITAEMIKEEVSDYGKNIFYISGPQPMVTAFEAMLSEMGIPVSQIKTDYFLGYTETHQALK